MAGITADSLVYNINNVSLRTAVADIARTVTTCITAANETGMSSIQVEIPGSFNFGNLSQRDAQTLVYSEIIRMYVDSGFNVHIDIRSRCAILHIHWKSYNIQDREARLTLIKEHIWVPKRQDEPAAPTAAPGDT